MGTIPHLSFSRLGSYNGCGERYRLQYVEQIPMAPSGYFIGGIAIHDTIEEAEKHAWWNDKDMWQQAADATGFFEAKFDELLDRFSEGDPSNVYWAGRKTKQFPNGEDRTWWMFNGPMMLRRYADTRRWDAERGYSVKSEGVEAKVVVKLPSGTPVEGRIDAMLMVTDDGEIIVRDWKTGRPGDGSDYALQIATYCWLAREAGLSSPTAGEIAFLRSQERSKRLRSVPVPDLIDLVPRIYGDLEHGINAGFFPLKPSWQCKSCGVRAACDYGRRIG